MDVNIYEVRVYQPLNSMSPQAKFFLNTLNVMLKDMFNENPVLPGC